MTTREFSDGFSTLLNSYTGRIQFGEEGSGRDINLNEYEKSLFLTEAQEAITLSVYTGKSPIFDGFEVTEETRRYLSNLVETAELSPETNLSGNILGMGSTSKFFTLPDGKGEKPAVWFITYEKVNIVSNQCGKAGELDVVPVTQDEYNRLKRNPFRGANDRRALRLDLSDGVIEIISKYEVSNYYIRYVRKPRPIILANLDGLTIEGERTVLSEESPCELHEALHKKILETAVDIALRSKSIGVSNKEN